MILNKELKVICEEDDRPEVVANEDGTVTLRELWYTDNGLAGTFEFILTIGQIQTLHRAEEHLIKERIRISERCRDNQEQAAQEERLWPSLNVDVPEDD